MELLPEALEKHTTMITVIVDVNDFNDQNSDMLIKAFRKHAGKCPVRLKLRDNEDGHDLDLRSKSHRVDPVGFIQWLRDTAKLKFTLNNKGMTYE
jgi:hypothetical protein